MLTEFVELKNCGLSEILADTLLDITIDGESILAGTGKSRLVLLIRFPEEVCVESEQFYWNLNNHLYDALELIF